MFAKIVIGILIGFVGGLIEAGKLPVSPKSLQVLEILLFLVGGAFVVSSFLFGVIYGVMAIAEITIGFYAYGRLFRSEKAKS